MALPSQQKLTPAEYLALEREAEFKSEYIDGEVFAMAGARLAHITICTNLAASLGTKLRGTLCRALVNDMRVRTPRTDLYAYPDLAIVCGDVQLEDEEFDTLLNPVVLIEVLSPSTEAWDRGGKFARYQTIESLQEYVLVSQAEARIETYTREADHWVLTTLIGEDAIWSIRAASIEVPVMEIYERVDFTKPSRPGKDWR